MGKQLSIYLNEIESKRLTEIAIRECRRPHDQVRYILLNALGLATNRGGEPIQTTNPNQPIPDGDLQHA